MTWSTPCNILLFWLIVNIWAVCLFCDQWWRCTCAFGWIGLVGWPLFSGGWHFSTADNVWLQQVAGMALCAMWIAPCCILYLGWGKSGMGLSSTSSSSKINAGPLVGHGIWQSICFACSWQFAGTSSSSVVLFVLVGTCTLFYSNCWVSSLWTFTINIWLLAIHPWHFALVVVAPVLVGLWQWEYSQLVWYEGLWHGVGSEFV